MKLIGLNPSNPGFPKSAAVTVGNFDGVHRGHQALLDTLKRKATELGLPTVVILFEPQPAEFFNQQQAPARLTTLREKLDCLAGFGIDYVYCLRFNSHLATLNAEDFIQTYLFDSLNSRYLIVGEDFRFGAQRQGNLNLLRAQCQMRGCEVEAFADYVLHGQRVSSTLIRKLLQRGDLQSASTFLGRPYSMIGRVMKGAGRGRQWGIPTANLHMNRLVLPLKGVYTVEVIWQGNAFQGVANLGVRPTVDGLQPVLEVHLLEFNHSLYGEWLKVNFLGKLRDEIKFNTIEDLLQQIHRDIQATRDFFRLTIEHN